MHLKESKILNKYNSWVESVLVMKIFNHTYFIKISSFISAIYGSSLFAAEELISDSAVMTDKGYTDHNMVSNLIQTTLGLLVILALIGGAAWLFKRYGQNRIGLNGHIKVVGGLSLGARERIVILQVGKQQLVIGVTPSSIQTLHTLDEPLTDESGGEVKNSFSSNLKIALANRMSGANSGSGKL